MKGYIILILVLLPALAGLAQGVNGQGPGVGGAVIGERVGGIEVAAGRRRPNIIQNFVGTASPRSSSFVTFASLGYIG